MNIIEVCLIGLALAMDAFAVSIANGVIIKNMKLSYALVFGIYFGVAQCVMALIGWLVGKGCVGYLFKFGTMLAFVLLLAIGCNMIIEGVKKKETNLESGISNKDILKWSNMSILAIATSIDALVVGVSLAIVNTYILHTSLIIGLFAFCLSIAGVFIGNRFNNIFRNYAEIIGGIILVLLAIKILMESIIHC